MSTSNQEQPPKRCSSCVHCFTFEYGYSNWTVEGKTRVCMLHKHPEPEFDNWYDENPADRATSEIGSWWSVSMRFAKASRIRLTKA